MKNNFFDKLFSGLFFISALISIITVLLISYFLFVNGLPAFIKIGFGNFIFGRDWSPTNIPPSFGIFPMIVASIFITFGAVLFGVPIGVLTSIFLVKYASIKLYKFLKPAINLMAGIPSIVYGFFGLVVLVPITGYSVLTASLLLGIMILPTIINLSETAIRSVASSYYEGAIALGASHERAIFSIVLPAAKSGIISSIILGIGRAIGETMAVVMVAGNQPIIPRSIFQGSRTLTSNIVMEMGYAADLHREALISTGVVLFIFILILNICFSLVKRRSTK